MATVDRRAIWIRHGHLTGTHWSLGVWHDQDPLPPDKWVLRIVDLKTVRCSTLPGSQRLWSSRWSLDGRHVLSAALPKWNLMLYDVRTHEQTQLTEINSGWASWARDSQYV